MADNKHNIEEIKALALKDLESVAGGRFGLRPSEERDMQEVHDRVMDKIDSLKNAGKMKQARALESDYLNAYEEWINDIKTTPESGCDILLSDYIEVW